MEDSTVTMEISGKKSAPVTVDGEGKAILKIKNLPTAKTYSADVTIKVKQKNGVEKG